MHIATRREISNDFLVYISVLEEELSYLESFLFEFQSKGIAYFLNVINHKKLENETYLELCEEKLRESTLAIINISDRVMNDESYYNFTMLESGVVLGKNKPLFLINNLKDFKIYETSPIRNVQLSSAEKIISDLDKYQSLPKDLFGDTLTNFYAKKRIFYISLLVMFDISYKTIKKIKDRLECSLNDAVTYLEESVFTGVTVLHFGGHSVLKNPAFWPYENEMKTIEADFPVKSAFNKLKILKFDSDINDDDDVLTFKMELIIPNHEILGVSFQPFFEIDGNSILPSDIKRMLINDNVKEENIKITETENDKYRIYFLMSNPGMDGKVQDCLQEKYGTRCNYVYPK